MSSSFSFSDSFLLNFHDFSFFQVVFRQFSFMHRQDSLFRHRSVTPILKTYIGNISYFTASGFHFWSPGVSGTYSACTVLVSRPKNQPEKEWKQWFATGKKSGPEESRSRRAAGRPSAAAS